MTSESACAWCLRFDVLYALHPEGEEHQEWLCESCESIALARHDGDPLNPPDHDSVACSYCGVVDAQNITTGDDSDPFICLDCVERMEETRALQMADAFHSSRLLSISSQGTDRKPQPPTRSIVGGPGEDQSAATLDHTPNS